MNRQDSAKSKDSAKSNSRFGWLHRLIWTCLPFVLSQANSHCQAALAAQGSAEARSPWVLVTMDGLEQTVVAPKLSETELQFQAGSERKTIPIKRVKSLRRESQTTVEVDQGSERTSLTLRLNGGSIVRVESVQMEDSKLRCQPGLEVPVSAVKSLRFGNLTEEQEEQWGTYSQTELSSDLLVIKQSSGALTKIDGIVNSIGGEAVEFEFSGQTIPVPLAKIAAVRFYSTEKANVAVAGVVKDLEGNEFAISSASSSSQDELQLALAGGGRYVLPLAKLARVDFGLGNSKSLTEIPFDITATASELSAALPSLSNISVGRARVVPAPKLPGAAQGPVLEVLGDCQLTFSTLGSFTKLTGGVQMVANNSYFTPCRVEILLESKSVWETVLDEPKSMQRFEIPIPPDNRLSLRVVPLDKSAVGTRVQWLDPELTK
ncbi:MAG: hypothetical protein ACE361_08940 [Aureliella sp.]